MSRPRWFVRPLAIGDRPIHPNAHVPKYGWKVQHLYTETEWVAMRALRTLGKRLDDDSWLVKDGSLTKIQSLTAKFTGNEKPLARATLRDALERLIEKHVIQRWDAVAGKPAGTRSRGDGRWLTCWRILSWKDTLAAIAADDRIASPQRRTFYVIGKGKRLVTKMEAAAWKLNVQTVEQAGPKAWAGTMEEFEELKLNEAVPDSLPPAKTKPPDETLVNQDVLSAARRNTQFPADPVRVERFAAACVKVAAASNEVLDSGDICAILDLSARHFKNGIPRNFEGHMQACAAQTRAYLHERAARAQEHTARERRRTGTDDMIPAKDIPSLWNEENT